MVTSAPEILLSLAFADWPVLDRERWQTASARKGGRFIRRSIASDWRAATLANYQQQYGAWLSFLHRRNALDTTINPGSRVSPALMDLYVNEMLARGYRGPSVATRIIGLRHALRLLAPESDFGWIAKPEGHYISSILEMAPRAKKPRPSGELFSWGLELIENSLANLNGYVRALGVRDGLIIAFLASRGMRRRSLASLELGRNIKRQAITGQWKIEFAPEDMKSRNNLSYALPRELWPHIDRYLCESRQLLLRGGGSLAFWIGARGRAMADDALGAVVLRRSTRRFGEGGAFRPHAFRYSLATSIGLGMPDNPGAAACLLGNGAETVERHYDWSQSSEIAALYQEAMAPERERRRIRRW